jgi:alpha-L-arabinofuranosidase
MYRWPGGNFRQRLRLARRHRRPRPPSPARNPAWTGVEHNDFRTRRVPGFLPASGQRAGDHGQHGLRRPLLGPPTGRVRQRLHRHDRRPMAVEERHPEPYGVKYWCVGNEMWGAWQLGFMQLEPLHAEAQPGGNGHAGGRPRTEVVGSGALGRINRQHDPNEKRGWSRGMLEECASLMDYIAEHFYQRPQSRRRARPRGADGHSVRQKAEGHRKLQAELGCCPTA